MIVSKKCSFVNILLVNMPYTPGKFLPRAGGYPLSSGEHRSSMKKDAQTFAAAKSVRPKPKSIFGPRPVIKKAETRPVHSFKPAMKKNVSFVSESKWKKPKPFVKPAVKPAPKTWKKTPYKK